MKLKRRSMRLSLRGSKTTKRKEEAHNQYYDDATVELEERMPASDTQGGWSAYDNTLDACTEGFCANDKKSNNLETCDNEMRDEIFEEYNEMTGMSENLFDKSLNKKKRFPLIAAMRQKLKESKARKTKKLESQPQEIVQDLEEREAPPHETQAVSTSDSFITYEQWEKFMDTVAFPENSLAYKQLIEYMTNEKEDKDARNESGERAPEPSLYTEKQTFYTEVGNEDKIAELEEQDSSSTSSSPSSSTSSSSSSRPARLSSLPEEYAVTLSSFKKGEAQQFRATKKEQSHELRAPATRDDQSSFNDTPSNFHYGHFDVVSEAQSGDDLSLLQSNINESSSFITYGHWEAFMDTLAFPEKHITDKNWAKLVNIVEFPDKFARRKYQELKSQEAIRRKAQKQRMKQIKEAKNPQQSEKKQKMESGKVASDRYSHGAEELDKESRPEDIPVLYTIHKWSKDERLGLGLENSDGKEGLYVNRVLKKSKLAGFKVGMKILAINGSPCPETEEEAINLLKTLDGKIDIIVQGGHSNPLLAAGSMRDVVVGDILMKDVVHDIKKQISTDSEDTKYHDDTDDADSNYLSLCDTVEWSQNSIVKENNRPSTASVRSRSRKITMAGMEESETSSEISKTFSTYKCKDESVGVSFMKSPDWPGIFVQNISAGSKFGSSGLKVGMKLIQINGNTCPQDFDEAMTMILDTQGKLELVLDAEEHSKIQNQNTETKPPTNGLLLQNSLRLDE